MAELLFVVEDVFMITRRGVVLVPGVEGKNINTGAPIKLIRPDKSELLTIVAGIDMLRSCPIMVGRDLTKADVPIGTEVWTVD